MNNDLDDFSRTFNSSATSALQANTHATPEQLANRDKLINALERLQEGPLKERPDFVWNYNTEFVSEERLYAYRRQHPELTIPEKCGSIGCAAGLAYVLGITDRSFDYLENSLGLSSTQYFLIFYNGRTYGCADDWSKVTAAMVVQKLRELPR